MNCMSGNEAQHAPAQQAPARCENCDTPLQGHYCHACGQSVHNPMRHFGHAVEEFFEAFWHLDGRVFRTLRDLMAPGRVAANYLAGKRVRYIAPLRLFVILSLLTFFVGKLVVHVDVGPVQFTSEDAAEIANAATIKEVRGLEEHWLDRLSVFEKQAATKPGVNPGLVALRARIQGVAASRIDELERRQKDQAAGIAPAQSAATPTNPGSRPAKDPPRPTEKNSEEEEDEWKFNDRPWDEQTNPVDVGLFPAFADRWLNHKIGRAKENLSKWEDNVDHFVQAFFGAVPTALFLLMPVFALLLKVAYIGSGRRYLEHMVVALYSHAWLLLVLLAMFVLNAVSEAAAAVWVGITTSLLISLLWLWAPIYLFLMQRRVYGGHWAVAAVRYVVVGSVYLVMVTFVVLFAVLAGMAS
jgi:ribosomal protein L12E/L44/L45/RPP1/RPP2